MIITGGGGFLGQCLATALLKKGTIETETAGAVPLAKLVLADICFPDQLQPTIAAAAAASKESSIVVVQKQGDVSSRDYCDSLFQEECSPYPHISVFHLGAVMSGDGERDFDLCLRVNLHGTLHLLEAARATRQFPKFLLASAGATIGSGAPTDYIQRDDVIADATRATPHTTYGMTKACAELLCSDYARRGFVNGRGVRLPTVCVRAGLPNAAVTGCYSGVVREPLAGQDIQLPVARHVPHAVTGARAAVAALIAVHDCPLERVERVLGFDRTVFVPAVALSLGDLEEALYRVVTLPAARAKLGHMDYGQVDEKLSAVVGSFPTKVDAARARQLGIPEAPDAETLVREYMEDFPDAVADGIEATAVVPANERVQADKVAVVTGAGSGIGRAVAIRLSQGGWTVVLAGRRMAPLKETQGMLAGDGYCVSADVTREEDVARLFAQTDKRYGKVDLLFNNAGINSAATNLVDVDFAEFERILRTNVCGPFLCAREAMRLMARNGRGGRIINNGSISAHTPRPGSASYTASKHAVLGLTKCIALDGRRHNVACGQIDFGNVVSEISLRTNKPGAGALQANGTLLEEPFMDMKDATETFWAMANLPLEANVLQMTVLASGMPFVGRG